MPGEASRINGKKGGRPLLEASRLKQALIVKAEKRADELSDVLIEKALTGDIAALKELFDRTMGKVNFQIEHTGEVTLLIDV
jgi:hypothetical protein